MSVLFFLVALLLAAMAVWMAIRVILRRYDGDAVGREQQNIKVAKQRLNELQQRVEAGEIAAHDAADIQHEIEHELLNDVQDLLSDTTSAAVNRNTKALKQVAVSIAVLVPLVAGGMYWIVGQPESIERTPVATGETVQNTMPPSGGVGGDVQSLEKLTQRLLTHLSEHPKDAQGWSTLGQMYAAQERFAEAVGAYKIVRQLEGDSANFLVREADMLAMMNGGSLQGQPEALIKSALAIDPQHTGGLWLAGLAAIERGEVAAALEYWQRAEKSTDNTEMRTQLRQLIDGGAAELVESISDFEDQPTGAVIQVQVMIAPSVLQQVDLEDTVFIFARAFNGPPVPLAALKKQVKDLPLVVELKDSMAMLPNLNLSSFEQVQVTARVSQSGTTAVQSGDYFGESAVIHHGAVDDVVTITISQRVP